LYDYLVLNCCACRIVSEKHAELRPSSQGLQASSLQPLPQWQDKLTAIVLEMEKYNAGNLGNGAGDDDPKAERD
jgi:hypothetical protein